MPALEQPKVSIVIPTYDRVAYLLHAIQSVIGQTYVNWELLVLDDGSTDGTRSAVTAVRDARITVIAGNHCGNPAALRNRGLQLARGAYVAFLDSDDMWEAPKIERQLAVMASTGCGWSYTAFDMIDEAGRPTPRVAGVPWRPYSGLIIAPLLTTEAAVAISSLVVERALAVEVGAFDESERILFREDYDFCLRLALKAPTVAVPDALCHVRHHPGRSTSVRSDLHERSADVYRKVESMLPSATLRKVCRHRCAVHLVAEANARRAAGERRAALLQLRQAFRYRPLYARWWLVLTRLALRI